MKSLYKGPARPYEPLKLNVWRFKERGILGPNMGVTLGPYIQSQDSVGMILRFGASMTRKITWHEPFTHLLNSLAA